MPTAAVIGAGPVGCLTALGLQKRGYDVVVFEGRSEDAFAPSMAQLIGKTDGNEGASIATTGNPSHPLSRSINLAISVRGLTALKSVDPRLALIVLENAVPMRARMIHRNASTEISSRAEDYVQLDSQAYSTQGECINSVSRLLLSRLLLDEVLAHDIPVRWSHRLRSLSFASSSTENDRTLLKFDTHADAAESPAHDVDFDVVFGCDGHHSHVRRAMQAARDMQVEKTTVDNYYVELHIPASTDVAAHKGDVTFSSAYAFDPNHLHIWPRHDYMLIALANRDGSFTSTLFAPQRIFDQHLQHPNTTVAFFENQFPDALRALGAETLVQQVCQRKPSSLGMVRCSTYHLDGQALLLGDSAHAMVPFYGQGLNCGLEDVRIMFELLDREETANDKTRSLSARKRAFEAYSAERHADLLAINQLAIDNFAEMSSGVVRRGYILRKRIDTLLERHLPRGWWASLYTNVTFSNIGYAAARKHEARQIAFLQAAMSGVVVGSIIGTTVALSRVWSWWRHA